MDSHALVWPLELGIFLRLLGAEQNQRFLFVKNHSITFCCSGEFWHVLDVLEALVLFISTVFHVRSVSCCCFYPAFRASCAVRVTCVTCSKPSILGLPLGTKNCVSHICARCVPSATRIDEYASGGRNPRFARATLLSRAMVLTLCPDPLSGTATSSGLLRGALRELGDAATHQYNAFIVFQIKEETYT